MFAVSKTTRELLLKWSDDPVRLSSEVKMPQFLVEDVIAESCDESAVMGEDTALVYCVDVDSVLLVICLILNVTVVPSCVIWLVYTLVHSQLPIRAQFHTFTQLTAYISYLPRESRQPPAHNVEMVF